MKIKKNELYIIVSIMLVIIIVIASYMSYSVLVGGTLVFWIKNYNPPCNSNNTTQCTHETFRFNKILIDNEKQVSGNGTVRGGQIWKIDLKLSPGVHSITIIEANGREGVPNAEIETNKITCRHLPFQNNYSVPMVMPNYYACPP